MADIVCVGIVVVDALGKPVKKFPEKGNLVIVENLTLATGGCATNTGIGLKRLGADTAVIGKVGDDAFGKYVVGHLRDNGVDVSGIRIDSKVSTSFTYVAIFEDGERAFFHTYGCSGVFDIRDIDMNIVKGAKIIHIAGSYVMPTFDGPQTTEFLAAAKKHGLKTSLDTVCTDQVDDWLGLIEHSLSHIDYFLPSLIEARNISGLQKPEDITKFFLDKGVGMIALKMGLDGVYVASPDEAFHMPIYKVKTVDSTGAGDAFAAGFLRGILEGWSLAESARLGNAAAAFCVQAIGCTTGIKSFEETTAFQRSYDK